MTGRVEEKPPNPMEGMTEEQKEHEAMKLVNMFDKLSRYEVWQEGRDLSRETWELGSEAGLVLLSGIPCPGGHPSSRLELGLRSALCPCYRRWEPGTETQKNYETVSGVRATR